MATVAQGRPGTREAGALALILVAFVGLVAHLISLGASFEFDEAVYAVQARAWVTDAPGTGVELHRAPLLSAMALPQGAADASEHWFRVLGLVSGLGLILAAWWFARMVAGAAAGLIAAATVAMGPHLLQRSAQFLTDAPAAALLVLAAALLWRELVRDAAPGPRLLLFPLAIAAAVELRYGAALPGGLLIAAALVLWWRAGRPRPDLVVGASGLFVLSMAPHVVRAMEATDRPWGLITTTAEAGRIAGSTVGGVEDFVTQWPGFMLGPVAGVITIAGLLWALAGLRSRGGDRVALGVFAVVAVLDIVAIGVGAHAEARFIFASVAILSVLGASAIASRTANAGRAVRVVLVAVLAGGMIGSAVQAEVRTARARDSREAARAAAMLIADDAAGRPCSVVSFLVPVFTWYSGCAAYDIDGADDVPADGALYLALFDGPAFPQGTAAAGWPSMGGWREVGRVEGDPRRWGDATIYIKDTP